MSNIKELNGLLEKYLPPSDLELVNSAWLMTCRVCREEDHYLQHICGVASTLASMFLDVDTVISGMLYGVVDNRISMEELKENFGSSVAKIINSCTRMDDVLNSSKPTHKAEELCEQLQIAADNIRAQFVMLAGWLENTRSFSRMSKETRLKTARQSRDIYAPLATQLGIYWMKHEFENFFFPILHPDEYLALSQRVKSILPQKKQYVAKVIADFQKKLQEDRITPLRIIDEPLDLYSIYLEDINNFVDYERLEEQVIFVIIVDSGRSCFQTLKVLLSNWSPLPGTIADYISAPTTNLYQAIHVTVSDSEGHIIKVRIRTEQMEKAARNGIAAYRAYGEFRVSLNDYENPLSIGYPHIPPVLPY